MNEGQTQQPVEAVGRRCYNCQHLPSFNADPKGAWGHCIKNNHRVSVDDCCGHFRRRAAAPDVAEAPLAPKTAFDSSALLGSVGLERRFESGESSGLVGAGGVDKLRVGEESLAGMKALARNDFLTAAYRFDQAKVACLLLGGYDPIAMGGGGAEPVRESVDGTAEKLPNA